MNLFNSIMVKRPGTSKFNMSHEFKFTANFGNLIPIFCQEVVPGDRFKVSSEIFARLMPLKAPLMHQVNVYVHYFFVPNRLVWKSWEDFITKGVTGEVTPRPPMIKLNKSGIDFGRKQGWYGNNTLTDYMGIPQMESTSLANPFSFSALPFAAYQLIYNEYYRDQTLEEEFGKEQIQEILEGAEKFGDLELVNLIGYPLLQLRTRAWEKDYFTSALPDPQRGPDVTINGVGSAGIKISQKANSVVWRDINGAVNTGTGSMKITGTQSQFVDSNTNVAKNVWPDVSGGLKLSNVNSSTINELRWLTKLQEWYELGARAGSRYIEQIMAHFGVRSSDARLQRPEYLGGGKSPIVIGDVLQTSATQSDSPQGTLAGRGAISAKSNQFNKFFEEHGFVIGIMSMLPRSSYSQGLAKMWSRESVFDYYFPKFAHLGEQEIKNKEIYAGTDKDDEVFGYTPRYAEYKYIPSRIAGDLRDSLSFWTLNRNFSSLPSLSKEFVHVDPTTANSVFADTTGEYGSVIVDCYNHVIARRPMPVFGTPML